MVGRLEQHLGKDTARFQWLWAKCEARPRPLLSLLQIIEAAAAIRAVPGRQHGNGGPSKLTTGVLLSSGPCLYVARSVHAVCSTCLTRMSRTQWLQKVDHPAFFYFLNRLCCRLPSIELGASSQGNTLWGLSQKNFSDTGPHVAEMTRCGCGEGGRSRKR